MVSVTIENLTKHFGETVALDQVSLRVEPGELFFLLGPSGCGKTTLLRSLAGFNHPDSGTIHFGDEDVTHTPAHQRNTGMMFQSYALWPHMTVAKNVAFGLEERRVSRNETAERVQEALASVRMEAYAERKINQLSGGQQQRVALARALVIRPRCLLLDEPLSNLDAKLRLEMRAEIRRICKESNLTAIYVTHDQKEALSISDRMAVLDHGRVAQVGTPEEVYRRPASRSVADFIGETNFLEATVLSKSDRQLTVGTPIGELTGYTTSDDWLPDVGEQVLVSVRPESWAIRETPAATNAIPGRVAETIYLGEVAEHRFVSAGITLKIFELNPRQSHRPSDVDFHAVADPEDVAILPAQ